MKILVDIAYELEVDESKYSGMTVKEAEQYEEHELYKTLEAAISDKARLWKIKTILVGNDGLLPVPYSKF